MSEYRQKAYERMQKQDLRFFRLDSLRLREGRGGGINKSGPNCIDIGNIRWKEGNI